MSPQYFVDYKLTTPYARDSDLPYATYFLQYIGFAAQVPNVIFNWLNVFLNPWYTTIQNDKNQPHNLISL